ncbi:MAG: hypothetical protein M1814_002131 [Vezdaea aestivalis]|nr:MAG: hypothetical protein M1814_002131 [Vezdaea aestivalis]
MPTERHTTQAPRPLMPTLSTGNKAQRPPLTPRIAGVGSPSSSSPLLRRGTAPAEAKSGSTPRTATKDHVSTPVKSFLASNITPRSSSRKAKKESTSGTPQDTPNGTPTNSRPTTADSENNTPTAEGRFGSEVGSTTQTHSPDRPQSFVGEARSHRPSKSITGSRSPNARPEPTSDGSGGQDSPRFFLASDARTTQPMPRPPLSTTKSSSFFYADGSRESVPTTASLSTIATSTPPTANGESRPGRFFHSNDVNEQHVIPPPSAHAAAGSRSSPRVAGFGPGAVARPPSPPKLAQRWAQPHPGNFKGPQLVSPPSNRPITAPYSQPRHAPPTAVRNDTPQRRTSHGRSASVGSVDSTPSTVSSSYNRVLRTDSFSTTASTSFLPHLSSEIAEETSVLSDLSLASPPPILSPPSQPLPSPTPRSPQAFSPLVATPTSPTKPSGGPLAHLNALAEQARRERKVQDLEISNSSLLAINRALEREMRKQSVELRRFRRLSRSGRLSLAGSEVGPELRPKRKRRRDPTLGSVDEEGEEDDEFESGSNQTGEETTEEEDEEDEEEDEIGDASSYPLSEDAKAKYARQRARDEKRLHADLRKHRQLLADSTRMNQSLKRCLSRTETMIDEGRKALAFAVRVSEVELGGRVLTDHGDEEEDEGRLERRFESGRADSDEKAERDSGVDFSTEVEGH